MDPTYQRTSLGNATEDIPEAHTDLVSQKFWTGFISYLLLTFTVLFMLGKRKRSEEDEFARGSTMAAQHRSTEHH